MIRSFPTLFFAGAVFGGLFVLSFFIGRVDSRRRRPADSVKRENGKCKRRERTFARFCFDFSVSFAGGAYLVLYDATVLGGRGRLVHLAVFFLGVLSVRFLFLKLLFRPTERAVSILCFFVLTVVRLFCFPVRKCFSVLFSILCRLYLILKRKNDKMRKKKQAKREIAQLCSMMDNAFLPAAVTEAIASGRD